MAPGSTFLGRQRIIRTPLNADMQRNATELAFERVVYPEAGGVRRASFDELDVDLGSKPRRNWDLCRVSQERGGPWQETNVRECPA